MKRQTNEMAEKKIIYNESIINGVAKWKCLLFEKWREKSRRKTAKARPQKQRQLKKKMAKKMAGENENVSKAK